MVNVTTIFGGIPKRNNNMDTKKLVITVGIVTLLISISTWVLDLSNLVEACIYCRNERTIIGLLAIILLLPKHRFISTYLAVTLGFYGAYVAADQIFNNMLDAKIGIFFILAIGALFIITLQIGALLYYFHDINGNQKK